MTTTDERSAEAIARDAELEAMPKLNLGCGRLILDDFINVDMVDLAGVDQVADLDQPWPWADGSIGYIEASHVFEHVASPVLFMTETWRVLAEGGAIDIRCPWYLHRNAYTDPTHRRYCTEETWDYWCVDTGLFNEYGSGLGGGPAGARFRKVFERLNRLKETGETCEVQVVLVKVD